MPNRRGCSSCGGTGIASQHLRLQQDVSVTKEGQHDRADRFHRISASIARHHLLPRRRPLVLLDDARHHRGRWSDDPQYSHGYLVPLFALYLLWVRRDRSTCNALHANGLASALLGMAMALAARGGSLSLRISRSDFVAARVAGLFMLAGGWPALIWSWPAVAFLAFMIPLPHSVSLALSAPMQTIATNVSTFALQVLGRPAIAEGNVILLNEIELGIVEACSGLRMLVVVLRAFDRGRAVDSQAALGKAADCRHAMPIALASECSCASPSRGFATNLRQSFRRRVFPRSGGLADDAARPGVSRHRAVDSETLLIEGPNRCVRGPDHLQHASRSIRVALYRRHQTPRREKEADQARRQRNRTGSCDGGRYSLTLRVRSSPATIDDQE